MSSFEEKYYEYEQFWDEEGIGIPGRRRIMKTVEMIPSNVKTILDVGCGNGIFCNILNKDKKFDRIVGVDRSNAALKYVETEKLNCNIDVVPLKDGEFDLVSCLQVLEHIPHNIYDKSLKEIARLSKKYVLISVPIEEDLSDNYTKCPECQSIFNFDLHLRSYKVHSFKEMLKPYGFNNLSTVQLLKGEISYGILMYYKLRTNKFSKFRAPICPICGYENLSMINQNSTKASNVQLTAASPNPVKKIFHWSLHNFFPKKTKPYWIIGLFEKDELH